MKWVLLLPLWLSSLTGHGDGDVCEHAIKVFARSLNIPEQTSSREREQTRPGFSGTNPYQQKQQSSAFRLKQKEEALEAEGCHFIRQTIESETKVEQLCVVELKKDITIYSTLYLNENTLLLPGRDELNELNKLDLDKPGIAPSGNDSGYIKCPIHEAENTESEYDYQEEETSNEAGFSDDDDYAVLQMRDLLFSSSGECQCKEKGVNRRKIIIYHDEKFSSGSSPMTCGVFFSNKSRQEKEKDAERAREAEFHTFLTAGKSWRLCDLSEYTKKRILTAPQESKIKKSSTLGSTTESGERLGYLSKGGMRGIDVIIPEELKQKKGSGYSPTAYAVSISKSLAPFLSFKLNHAQEKKRCLLKTPATAALHPAPYKEEKMKHEQEKPKTSQPHKSGGAHPFAPKYELNRYLFDYDKDPIKHREDNGVSITCFLCQEKKRSKIFFIYQKKHENCVEVFCNGCHGLFECNRKKSR